VRRHALKRPLILVLGIVLVSATAGLIAWASRGARESGLRAQCANRMRQTALALLSYSFGKGNFPPCTIPRPALPPERRLSWYVTILNHTDYTQGISIEFNVDRPWDSHENLCPRVIRFPTRGPRSVVESGPLPRFPFYRCPAISNTPTDFLPELASYVGIAGIGIDAPYLLKGHPHAGIFGYNRSISIRDITDGLSTTMILAETKMNSGPWTASGTATVRGLDPSRQPYIGRGLQFGGLHRDGVMVAMADGSVQFLRETIEPKVFEALSTVAGGETLPAGWDR
jgi:prepilin-type processing-associated H-X9-DG protein